jgi:hypothetical protein
MWRPNLPPLGDQMSMEIVRFPPDEGERGAPMNYNQPDDFERSETGRQEDEPTRFIEEWNSRMFWEVALILLVALVMIFCAVDFSV